MILLIQPLNDEQIALVATRPAVEKSLAEFEAIKTQLEEIAASSAPTVRNITHLGSWRNDCRNEVTSLPWRRLPLLCHWNKPLLLHNAKRSPQLHPAQTTQTLLINMYV